MYRVRKKARGWSKQKLQRAVSAERLIVAAWISRAWEKRWPRKEKKKRHTQTEIATRHAQRTVSAERFGHDRADFGEGGVIVILPFRVVLYQLFDLRVGRGRGGDGEGDRRQKSHIP